MSKRFALGAIIGAIAGAVAGVLTAPKSGKETRQDLKKKADDVRGEATDAYEATKSEVSKRSREAKSQAKDVKTRAERAAKAAQKEFTKKDTKKR